jgi:hypothetical protein
MGLKKADSASILQTPVGEIIWLAFTIQSIREAPIILKATRIWACADLISGRTGGPAMHQTGIENMLYTEILPDDTDQLGHHQAAVRDRHFGLDVDAARR